MPRRSRNFLKLVLRRPDEWDWEVEEPESDQDLPPAARTRSRRFASAAMFTTLFFTGAAFTAGAGDQLAKVLDDDTAAVAEANEIEAARQPVAAEPASEPAAEPVAAPVETPVAAPAPAPAPLSEPVAEAVAEPVAEPVAGAPAPASEPAPEPVAAPDVAPANSEPELAPPAAAPVETAASRPSVGAPAATPAKAPAKVAPPPVKAATKKWVLKRVKVTPPRAPEIEHEHELGYGEPTIWLNRALPDPTPPSARLNRAFARRLVAAAKRHDADWAAVLGVLRAQGERGPVPATVLELDRLAARLSNQQAWRGALALSGRTGLADRAEALADLYRSVGIEALVTGYAASKDRLAKHLLANPDVLVYEGGRADIAAGRIDVRVLVLLGYLAERHGAITVSSLFSGHRKYARPGVVSAHTFGHAVDIAAVSGTSIAGHQAPGGVTEATVRSVLLLPAELQPQQVISLLGLGGPSFPLRDHGDHIHVGF
jgi:hypothetical protein